MQKGYAAAVGAGLWCVREELVALGRQALHVRFDIVRAKADVDVRLANADRRQARC